MLEVSQPQEAELVAVWLSFMSRRECYLNICIHLWDFQGWLKNNAFADFHKCLALLFVAQMAHNEVGDTLGFWQVMEFLRTLFLLGIPLKTRADPSFSQDIDISVYPEHIVYHFFPPNSHYGYCILSWLKANYTLSTWLLV